MSTGSYTLNCLLLGDALSQIFEIEIAPTKNVAALRRLIKEELKHAFRDIDAKSLMLVKVSYLMPTIGC